MKFKTIFLSIFMTAILIFAVSCSDGHKTDYPDDDTDALTDGDQLPEDTDPATDTDDEQDGDIIPVNDNDISDDPHHDSENEDTDQDNSGNDAEPDDSDSGSQNDNDQPVQDEDETQNDEEDSDPDETPDDEEIDDEPIPEKDDPNVVCTGIAICQDDFNSMDCDVPKSNTFFGQDAQYAEKGYCRQHSFSTTSDLVTDNNTDLIWQRNLPEKYDNCTPSGGKWCYYQEAVNYCENLTYAGYSDWRLPSIEELETIIDFGKLNPSADSSIFSFNSSNTKEFWSNTSSATSEASWIVNFANGVTTTGSTNAQTGDKYYARCVRGDELIKPTFKIINPDSAEPTVKDALNDLIWTKNSSDFMSWQAALDYCKKLNYAGEKGWRLPNINELSTILDHSIENPASNFPDIASTYFWSSSAFIGNEYKKAWRVYTYTGKVETINKTNTAKVLCVK